MFNKISFIGADTYPVLNPNEASSYVGGESVQHTLLAKAFAQLGYEVSIVTKDYGQENGETIDSIRVWKTFKEQTGFPVVRYVYPRVYSLLKALKNADADVYYQSCAGMQTGIVAWFARRHNRKFVFRTAHDTDCIPGRQLIRFWRDRKLYEYGLRRAHLVAVQGLNQQTLLKENYGLKNFVVNMAVEIPAESDRFERDIDVLWVNNIRPFKRPELAIDLSGKLRDCRFVMIGGPVPGHESYFKQIQEKAQNLPNLWFLGHMPYSEVNEYFLRAKVFVNTSSIEGFPNSFLQAWARRLPVVSFFDPDDLIKKNSLGEVPGSLQEMTQSVTNLLANDDLRAAGGEHARKYVENNFSPITVARRYITLINKLYL